MSHIERMTDGQYLALVVCGAERVLPGFPAADRWALDHQRGCSACAELRAGVAR